MKKNQNDQLEQMAQRIEEMERQIARLFDLLEAKTVPYHTYDRKLYPNHKDDNDYCFHRNCPYCHGTGRNELTGSWCAHMISCPCPRCTPHS